MFIASLRESLENYLQENPDADRQDMIKKFGSPEEIADSYLSSLETQEVAKKVGTGKRKRKFLVVAVVVGEIEDGNATKMEVKIAADVMYVWNTDTNEAVSLIRAANPYLYVPELSDYTISSGDFNVALTDTDVRLSVTASMSFEVENGEFVAGGDISNITNQNGKSTVVTNADTYAIEVDLEQLVTN